MLATDILSSADIEEYPEVKRDMLLSLAMAKCNQVDDMLQQEGSRAKVGRAGRQRANNKNAGKISIFTCMQYCNLQYSNNWLGNNK